MTFWGVEIKPGKFYTHRYDKSCGRLRISQATLGKGKPDTKTTVQCNVGSKAPILLCNLISNVLETCHLELEFEELEEVVFSVLGQRSVHLTGYYVRDLGAYLEYVRGGDEDDTDSYGEDIADTDASDGLGSDYSDEDAYESDFIDDDGIEMFPHSSQRKSSVVIEEIIEDDKPSKGNANGRRLKKRDLDDSDDAADGSQGKHLAKRNSSVILESEDEDGFPICFSSRRKNVVMDSERGTSQPCDGVPPSENGLENDEKSKKKKKKRAKDERSLETSTKSSAAVVKSVEPAQEKDEKEADIHKDDGLQSAEVDTEAKSGGDSGNQTEEKTKKKKKTKKRKTAEAPVEESGDKSAEGTEAAVNDEVDHDSPVRGEPQKLPDQSDVADPSVPSTNDSETSGKRKKKNKKKRAKDDRGSDAEGGDIADIQTDAKKKRKDNKNDEKDLATAQESGEDGKSGVTKSGLKMRTFSNGLLIEELAMGKPDGQKATPGKKVLVNYIGKLKNGTIFDSNVGKRPFPFRLGIGQVIKGWDVGVNGMREGDKRRLTIPPSYGYGHKAAGPIPPNSWLIFDVELVSVK